MSSFNGCVLIIIERVAEELDFSFWNLKAHSVGIVDRRGVLGADGVSPHFQQVKNTIWLGTFIVNVILAQAAFQMALSCKTPEEGQKGLKLAAIFGIPFTLLAISFGLSAAAVVAVLFWRLATKEAVVGSMIAGFVSGISWYHFGGWLPNEFYLNVHPVWVGMSANIIFVVGITLIQ